MENEANVLIFKEPCQLSVRKPGPFTWFVWAEVVQADQGTNFLSKTFKQHMQYL